MALSLTQWHGLIMILAWMLFGSTGILFARYGRSLRFGARQKLLGKAVWFQIHRFLLSLTPLLTLIGFLLILVRAGGQWVNPQVSGLRLFVHSILGSIILCCVIIQIWLALYRCHPQSRFRFIFDLSHRITGLLAFILSIPTIFLSTSALSLTRPNLFPIFSCWAAWMVIIMIILETIQYQQRVAALAMANNGRVGDANQENIGRNVRPDTEAGTNVNVGNQRHNQIKLLIIFCHIIISITLSVSLIVFLCK